MDSRQQQQTIDDILYVKLADGEIRDVNGDDVREVMTNLNSLL